VKERNTIIESAIRHLSLSGSVASTLEISHDAERTNPLNYYLTSHLVDFSKHTATLSQKINNISCHHFQIVNDLPEKARLNRWAIFLENKIMNQ